MALFDLPKELNWFALAKLILPSPLSLLFFALNDEDYCMGRLLVFGVLFLSGADWLTASAASGLSSHGLKISVAYLGSACYF